MSLGLPANTGKPEAPDLLDREEKKEKWECQDREECSDRPDSLEKQISAPQVMLSSAKQTRIEGGNTNFYCTAAGNPRPRMEWRFKGRKLQSGSKHWIKDDGELNIKHYSDAGQ